MTETNNENDENITGSFHCILCDKSYSTRGTLWKHKKSEHKGLKYACNQCAKQFIYQSDLSRHIKGVHEGVRYECNQCEYQSTQRSDLRIHTKYIIRRCCKHRCCNCFPT